MQVASVRIDIAGSSETGKQTDEAFGEKKNVDEDKDEHWKTKRIHLPYLSLAGDPTVSISSILKETCN